MGNTLPRFIAAVNTKGGVGKTTTTIGTALALVTLGYTVEVRDVDPQGSATSWAMQARQGGTPLPFDVRVANRMTVGEPPADPDTWVLIDTPPSQSDLIGAAVDASSLVILVSTPGRLDLERMAQTRSNIGRASSVLLTQTKQGTVSLRDAEAFLAEHQIGRFDTMIPFREGIRRATGTATMPPATGYGSVAYEILQAWGLR